MSAHRVLALVATLIPAGCDYFAPPDPLALDPDVISIAIVLVAGETGAHLLAGYPHRPVSDPPSNVTASLVGPGWRVAFTDSEDGCGYGGMPVVCLNAALPEPIREGATYMLEGEGPKGSFTGETVVPAAPLVLDPGDTLLLRRPPGSTDWFRIPVRYRAPPGVGTLNTEMFATLGDSTGTRSGWIPMWPRVLDVEGQVDTLQILRGDEAEIQQGTLHLLGIGWHYTNFLKSSRIRFPWPNFGISGKGVYGYFDGSTKSRRVHIIVEEQP